MDEWMINDVISSDFTLGDNLKRNCGIKLKQISLQDYYSI